MNKPCHIAHFVMDAFSQFVGFERNVYIHYTKTTTVVPDVGIGNENIEPHQILAKSIATFLFRVLKGLPMRLSKWRVFERAEREGNRRLIVTSDLAKQTVETVSDHVMCIYWS